MHFPPIVKTFLATGLLLGLTSLLRGMTLIYPVEAIADLEHLSYDDYKTQYAGINITGLGISDEGWYVRYRHENLTYMFGPLPDRETANQKSWELETVRNEVIKKRPALSTSTVDIVKFTFSGVYGKGGGNSPYEIGRASCRERVCYPV